MVEKKSDQISETMAKIWKETKNAFPAFNEILSQIPEDQRLGALMAYSSNCIDHDPGNANTENPDFIKLQRDNVQGWIDGLYATDPQMAEKLDRELNPELK